MGGRRGVVNKILVKCFNPTLHKMGELQDTVRGGLQLVCLFAARCQHFFATKNGWGSYPWGYMQNPKSSRHPGHPSLNFDTKKLKICLATSSKNGNQSILAFHSYYI